MRSNSRFRNSSVLAAPALLTPAYANTLTGMIGQLYAGMEVVSRGLVGFIPSVTLNASAARAAVGQPVTFGSIAPIGSVDIVPAMTPPTPGDFSVDPTALIISKAKAVRFALTGEEQLGLNNGVGALSVQAQNFAQALGTLVNEMETDIALEAALNSSRAFGTAGTTPFGTNVGESAQIRKILDDNGAPAFERSLVGDTSMGANLRTLANLTKANEAGTTMGLRDGELLNLNGLSIKESMGTPTMGSGSAASATTNAAGYPVGATVITLAVAGTGSFVSGGIVTFAGDTNKYILASGDPDVSNGGTITLAKPGLRKAIPAIATGVTQGGTATRNVGFSRDAIHFATRAPALPDGRDLAVERMQILDQRSGMVFEISIYAGYKMMMAEVGAAWGQRAIKPAHIATLLG